MRFGASSARREDAHFLIIRRHPSPGFGDMHNDSSVAVGVVLSSKNRVAGGEK
jgi:hypothetical protein